MAATKRSKPSTPANTAGRPNSKLRKTSTNATETAKPKQEGKVQKLLFSMDYGTKTLSLAYRFVKPGEEPSLANVHTVYFGDRDYHAPQMVAWSQHDGKFYWGYQVEKAIKTEVITHEDVIELWKLLLYKAHATSEVAKRVTQQLGSRSLQVLISTHLRAVVKEAKELIHKNQMLTSKAEDVYSIPLQLFLSVPQMWSAPANKIMVDAARDAGIQYVELVYEPQCAAAFHTYNIKDVIPKQLKAGDIILIADIGGGTGDFVSYECRQDCDVGAGVALRIAKPPQGALCGSEFVNQYFIEWLKKKAGDFDAKCKKLGLSQATCIKKASESFETIKQKFSQDDKAPQLLVIPGAQGSQLDFWDIKLTCKEIQSFFKRVISEIDLCLEEQKTDKTKVLLVPGGFGRSEYLLNELRSSYGDTMVVCGQMHHIVGPYQPVSRGALLRYKDVVTRRMNSNESFGIGLAEIWDPELHPDATYKRGQKMSNGRTCFKDAVPRQDYVEEDMDDSEPVVHERWNSLPKKIEEESNDDRPKFELWHKYLVPVDENTISVQIYWTELDIQAHEPILAGPKLSTSSLRSGIEPWGEPVIKALPPDLESFGYEKTVTHSKALVYELWLCLVLECEGANIKVKWQLARNGTQPYDENGVWRESKVEVAEDQPFTLCDARYNPSAREEV